MAKLPSSVLCIHAELGWVDSEEQVDVLRKYGGVTRGETVSRDILIPATMPLWVLHPVLQRSFGFTHSHLFRFENEEGDFGTGMHGPVEWADYDSDDEYIPSFPGGSFKRWLRKMYTGPYPKDGAPKVKECLPLLYNYDFGDNWHIYVSRRTGFKDLPLSEEELFSAIETVRSEKRPVQIAHDGDMLIEDVGNVDGFCRFLEKVKDIAPAVIKEKNDWISPEEMGYSYPGAYRQPEYREAGEGYLVFEDNSEEEEDDDSWMTPSEYLRWAYSQSWHREDYTDFDLL